MCLPLPRRNAPAASALFLNRPCHAALLLRQRAVTGVQRVQCPNSHRKGPVRHARFRDAPTRRWTCAVSHTLLKALAQMGILAQRSLSAVVGGGHNAGVHFHERVPDYNPYWLWLVKP